MEWSKKEAVVGANGSDSSDNSNHQVASANNRLYFYLEISILNQQNTLSTDFPAKIFLHINSYGGSVFAGLSAVDYIANSRIPVVSVIDGCAASAATLMSVVADERYMSEHSFMLIHQLSSTMWGKYEDLKDDMKNNEKLMEAIKGIYVEHTKIPKRKLNQILKRDLWFDARTCLKYGLVDDIITRREET